MDGIDNLEQVIGRAEAFEREQAQAADFTQQSEPEAQTVSEVDPSEAAGNLAESVLRIGEGAAKLLADSRLYLPDDEIEAGRQSLAPVIEKYDLTRGGSGKMPYQEEIQAGFYLGALFKKFRRAVAELRAKDKAEAKAKQEQKQTNGSQREHQSQEPAHALPSQERVRQEPNPDKEGWNTESWGESRPLG
jgi:Sec-independent protein translocase protein TatA